MAGMPPIPMGADDLESDQGSLEGGDEDTPGAGSAELDPQFAADISEAFPDLDDSQLAALQRAVLGLLGRA